MTSHYCRCGRRSFTVTIAKWGCCRACRTRKADGVLTGKPREKALRDIAAWLDQHPDPWERAGACRVTFDKRWERYRGHPATKTTPPRLTDAERRERSRRALATAPKRRKQRNPL